VACVGTEQELQSFRGYKTTANRGGKSVRRRSAQRVELKVSARRLYKTTIYIG
jgi:hypothetical protein